MDPADQKGMILSLMQAMRARESWCGETHIQKCVYLLQEGLQLPMEFEFVLYKHGPYSFDLHDLLGEMRADLLIDRVPMPFPYGPTLAPSSSGSRWLKRQSSATVSHYEAVELVAKRFGKRSVTELERIGTCLYVTRRQSGDSGMARAHSVVELKPHFDHDSALAVILEVDELLASSK